MPHLIVALVGYKGCGKSTAAKEFYVAGFTRVRFAEGLKNMLKSLGLTNEHVDGALKEEPCDLLNGVTPRFAMQTLGTEWGRHCIHPNFWIDHWKRQVDRLPAHIPVVVDDLRFPNEREALIDLGGKIIWVHRPDVGRSSDHPSEDLSHLINYVKEQIHNNGTEEEFKVKARELALNLKNRT